MQHEQWKLKNCKKYVNLNLTPPYFTRKRIRGSNQLSSRDQFGVSIISLTCSVKVTSPLLIPWIQHHAALLLVSRISCFHTKLHSTVILFEASWLQYKTSLNPRLYLCAKTLQSLKMHSSQYIVANTSSYSNGYYRHTASAPLPTSSNLHFSLSPSSEVQYASPVDVPYSKGKIIWSRFNNFYTPQSNATNQKSQLQQQEHKSCEKHTFICTTSVTVTLSWIASRGYKIVSCKPHRTICNCYNVSGHVSAAYNSAKTWTNRKTTLNLHSIYVYAIVRQYSNPNKWHEIHTFVTYDEGRYHVFTQKAREQMLPELSSTFCLVFDTVQQVYEKQ